MSSMSAMCSKNSLQCRPFIGSHILWRWGFRYNEKIVSIYDYNMWHHSRFPIGLCTTTGHPWLYMTTCTSVRSHDLIIGLSVVIGLIDNYSSMKCKPKNPPFFQRNVYNLIKLTHSNSHDSGNGIIFWDYIIWYCTCDKRDGT